MFQRSARAGRYAMPTCWRIWRLDALLVRSWLVVRMCLANKVMSLSIRWATATLAKDAWLVVALRFSKALLMRQGPLPQSSPKVAAVALLGVAVVLPLLPTVSMCSRLAFMRHWSFNLKVLRTPVAFCA